MKSHCIGRFVRDPELKEVGNTHVCEFSLAVDEFRKINGERKKYTNFFDFVIWDKAAELVVEHKRKGDQIAVECTARQDKWQDKNTGEQRSRVIFRVDDFTFLSSPNRRPAQTETPTETKEELEEATF